MKLPYVHGIIDRRLLVNFVADPKVVAPLLPKAFRPQLFEGKAVVGICLIRFSGLRPGFVPEFLGINSENAAHRIAVEWDTPSGVEAGVYIVRRDSSSLLKTLLGGRLFSGIHHRALFTTEDNDPNYKVAYQSCDGTTNVSVEGRVSHQLPTDSIFRTLERSSEFFKKGCVGYSPGLVPGEHQGMQLTVDRWKAEAFAISNVTSSFFADEKRFPKSSMTYDHSLIMRNIPHYWSTVSSITD